MKRAEKEEQLRKLNSRIADKSVDAFVAAQDMKQIQPDEWEAFQKAMRRVEDSIAEIKRMRREVEKLEFIECDEDQPVYMQRKYN